MLWSNMIICVGIGNGVMHSKTADRSGYEFHKLLGRLKRYVHWR